MIIVTGSCGFIGSNLIRNLNNSFPRVKIIAVDTVENTSFRNIFDLQIIQFIPQEQLFKFINENKNRIEIIFHQGAISSTTEQSLEKIYKYNIDYTIRLIDVCLENSIRLIYASSASVYGLRQNNFHETSIETPINLYAWSKTMIDQYVRNVEHTEQLVGLRYFNVYGPGESYKGAMASLIFKIYCSLKNSDKFNLFGSLHGEENGSQRRDFIHVDDIVKINMHFYKNANYSGIYNAGTGVASSFVDLATIVQEFYKEKKGRKVSFDFIDFPDELKKSYQIYTKSDNTRLRSTGLDFSFVDLRKGVRSYLEFLSDNF